MTNRDIDVIVQKRMKVFPYGENTYVLQNFKFSVERSTAYFCHSAHTATPDIDNSCSWLENHLGGIIHRFASEPIVSTFHSDGKVQATISEWNEDIEIFRLPVSRVIRVKYASLLCITNSTFHFLLKE